MRAAVGRGHRGARPVAVLVTLVTGLLTGCGPSEVPDRPVQVPSGAPVSAEPEGESAVLTPEAFADLVGSGTSIDEDGDFGLDLAELITTDDAPGGRLVRAHYPAGSVSPSGGDVEGGLQAYLRLPEPTDALELSYRVRFPVGFDFVKGGKLPGLFGGTEVSGGNIPDGTDGFSTRYMWRRGGAGEVYAYLPSSEDHGTSLGRGCWEFVPGRWTEMRQQVRLNTPGTADGAVTVWQDGQLVLSRTGLEFRTVADLRIDGVFFSTFFGGGDGSWASPTDQSADFADFRTSPVAGPPPTEVPPSGGAAGEDEDDEEEVPECSGTGV